jgi:ribonuclease Z
MGGIIMKNKWSILVGFGLGIIFCICILVFLALTPPPETSPVKALSEREVYYPGTEAIAPDEMRVVALGTGMPNARPKQAAACFLVELGNGDKFLFDAGTGSAERLSAMKISYDYIDRIFLGHLHSDHIGDLDAIWIGGVVANRVVPLRVWGPSGAEEKYGTKYMVEHLQKTFTWDVDGRIGNTDTRGLSMEWNGLKFAYSSDTYPNKWWMEHTKNFDIAIHECFASPKILIEKQKFPAQTALNVGTQVHTSPAQFGKVMAQIKPRMAIGYHFFNDYDTQPIVLSDIRETYEGPLSLAVDYMVWNVTKEKIKTRMAAVDEDIWPQPSVYGSKPADPSQRIGFSKYIWGGRVNYPQVLKKIYDDINKEYGTNISPPK